MSIKEYISSGKLELYVLGSLEPAEMREVEAMSAQHPEIRAELEQIELSLEGLATAAAPAVDPAMLDRLLTEVKSPPAAEPPADSTPKVAEGAMSTNPMSTLIPWVLAIGAAFGLFYFYSQAEQQESELIALQGEYTKLEQDCDEGQESLRSAQEIINELTKPSTKDVILAGTENAPDMSAIVFYNPTTQKTLFKATNLAPPPTGKQYQLWAIDADGPKNLGVLATNLAGDIILEVDHLAGVAAFAITLEDAGGKPTPDLTQLQVIGNVG